MAKPELGTKRICPVTGKKFYDLNQNPVISPYTGEIVPIDTPPRTRAEAARPLADDVEVPEVQEAEFVPLEEADAENTGAKVPIAGAEDVDDDVDLAEDIEDTEDDTFLEPSEDEDEDVSDIIGGDIENEEET